MQRISNYIYWMKRKEDSFGPIWELNPIWETLTPVERISIQQHLEQVQYAKNEIIHIGSIIPINEAADIPD